MEQLYGAMNWKIVAPLLFNQGLLPSFSTCSKVACNILSNLSPSGSYRTTSNWINGQTEESLKPPAVDHIVFDSSEIIGKAHHIQLDQYVRTSVIIIRIHINLSNTPSYNETLNSPVQDDCKTSGGPAVRRRSCNVCQRNEKPFCGV